MENLGNRLREARDEQGISLAEAGAATRIKERYLKALEDNDWASLPTHVQARGFLRNYAVFLGLSEDEVMSLYGQLTRSAVVSLPEPPAKESPVRTTNEDGAVFRPRDIKIDPVAALPSWLSSDVVIGVALALVIVVVGFALVQLTSDDSNGADALGTATPRITPLATDNPLSATDGASGVPGEGTAAPVTPTFDASTESVELSLESTEHVWVRITVDGTPVLEGILAPGTSQAWQATQEIVLETPNAAGLRAVVNGQPQGVLGERGQAVILGWGPNGQLPLTPTVSP
jgi:cytoskeletal protein RodZ